MKKIIFLLLITIFAVSVGFAQQEHHYTQFMYNKLTLNPAYAGARGVPSITAIYRNQWMGFEGAPKSVLASFNSPFLTPRVGVGVVISHNQIGLDRDFAGTLAYSYDLVPDEEVSLRAGIMGSVRSLSMDFSDAVTPDLAGPGADNSLETGRSSSVFANVGAGLYFTYDERFYAGFSVPRIYSNTIGLNESLPPGFKSAKESSHFYAMAGAIFPLNEDINIMPSVLTKYVKNAPFDVDVNVNLEIKEKVTAGISYRAGGNGAGDSMDLLLYWQAHTQFGAGIAYDYSLSDIRDYTSGSIERLFQVDLKRISKRKSMSNPRVFM